MVTKNQISEKCPHCGSTEGFRPGIVLDPFHGSGTSGVVSRNFNRAYIGIEAKEEYIKMSLKRLDEEMRLQDIKEKTNQEVLAL